MSSRPFHDFEQAGWESVALEYQRGFTSLTTQSIGDLLDAAGVGRNTRLLDVATGPGDAAAAAVSRGAQVVGVDFSTAMVALAKKRYPNIDFRQGDAEALPLPDDSFDAVVMNFGLLHLERPEQAMREAHRVLKPGGRFSFTVWARREESLGFQITLRAVEIHGNPNVPLPPGPPFFRFSDPKECERTLLESGFSEPQVTKIPQTWRLMSPDALFEIMKEATVRTRGLLRFQSAQALDSIQSAMREGARAFEKEGAVELAMPAVLAYALKG
ncbi:MAG TPA: methyltransferase domain-containing protein [Candidatus Binatia bacterium]|nr:methyltransferase domain-containing protein [Candidatus Binatia bacterium]